MQVTGANADCRIDNASKGLSQEQIDQMVAEAAQFAAEVSRCLDSSTNHRIAPLNDHLLDV